MSLTFDMVTHGSLRLTISQAFTMTILHGVVTKAGAMSKTVTVTISRKVVHPILLKVSSASCSSP